MTFQKVRVGRRTIRLSLSWGGFQIKIVNPRVSRTDLWVDWYLVAGMALSVYFVVVSR